MSTPRNPETVAPLDAIQSALNEIVSAQSSLNMPPERIEPAASDAAFTHGNDPCLSG